MRAEVCVQMFKYRKIYIHRKYQIVTTLFETAVNVNVVNGILFMNIILVKDFDRHKDDMGVCVYGGEEFRNKINGAEQKCEAKLNNDDENLKNKVTHFLCMDQTNIAPSF